MTTQDKIALALLCTLVLSVPAFAQGSRGQSDRAATEAAETAPAIAAPAAPEPALPEPTAPEPAEPEPEAPSGATVTAPAGDADVGDLAAAVLPCWDVSALTPEERAVSVTLAVRLSPDGVPLAVRFVSGSTTVIGEYLAAYQSARRAVVACGTGGLPLRGADPSQPLELTFHADEMRIE